MNCPRGPTIRPIWFLYEDAAFWWLTGSSYSRLGEWLARDPRVALVVDTCDLSTGEVLGVTAVGRAEVGPLDVDRAKRKLASISAQTRSFGINGFGEPSSIPPLASFRSDRIID